ncbi:MAG TPA: (Fe-S)-binding protein, partial [Kiloniellales bacterium]
MPEAPIRVGLFVTCLVDLFRPSVGFAAVKLLEQAGCQVTVPATQTCCGQPAYNSGDRADAKAIAADVIAAFDGFDYVVAPSGSCAGMLRVHYPELFACDGAMEPRARA